MRRLLLCALLVLPFTGCCTTELWDQLEPEREVEPEPVPVEVLQARRGVDGTFHLSIRRSDGVAVHYAVDSPWPPPDASAPSGRSGLRWAEGEPWPGTPPLALGEGAPGLRQEGRRVVFVDARGRAEEVVVLPAPAAPRPRSGHGALTEAVKWTVKLALTPVAVVGDLGLVGGVVVLFPFWLLTGGGRVMC